MAISLRELFTRIRVGTKPSDRSDLPIVDKKEEIVNEFDSTGINNFGSFSQFRQTATDRQSLYNAYDEMKTDSVIAAALEMYADDATQSDEQGRVIWVESDIEEIARAGNRLIDILELNSRAWKHIYQACTYGDAYLKLYRVGDFEEEDKENSLLTKSVGTKVVNDVVDYKGHKEIPNYEEYVEDVNDPSVIFDLRKRGKTAGFVEVSKEVIQSGGLISTPSFTFSLNDTKIYRPDRFVHIMLGEDLSRNKEVVTIDFGDGKTATYDTAHGNSVLKDVYPIQKELQLLEDSLVLNRLTRSALIRLLQIELGDMPKKEVNNYLRRVKNIIEQHVSMDKDSGSYKSFNAPGPIDNVLYIPTRNGKGTITVNNLGGDVNVRDIADIDYFNNKRAGALKIPRSYLGDDMSGSGLNNGGSLTRLDIRYARTVKRIQQQYIRAITTLLNLFFVDKKLDYVNKFDVRMTSPSTQEDLERNELIQNNLDLVKNIMDLTESLEGGTQKKILNYLFSNVMKMPEIATMIEEDQTPEEEVQIEGGGTGGGPDIDIDLPDNGDGTVDMSSEFSGESGEESGGDEGGFTDADFAEFEDQI